MITQSYHRTCSGPWAVTCAFDGTVGGLVNCCGEGVTVDPAERGTPPGTSGYRSWRHALPIPDRFAHNSAVLYRYGLLGPTDALPPGPGGYDGATDYTWVTPPPFSPDLDELINGDQVLDDGTIYKFFQLAAFIPTASRTS